MLFFFFSVMVDVDLSWVCSPGRQREHQRGWENCFSRRTGQSRLTFSLRILSPCPYRGQFWLDGSDGSWFAPSRPPVCSLDLPSGGVSRLESSGESHSPGCGDCPRLGVAARGPTAVRGVGGEPCPPAGWGGGARGGGGALCPGAGWGGAAARATRSRQAHASGGTCGGAGGCRRGRHRG